MIKRFPLTFFFILTFLLIWLSMAANVSGLFPTFGEWTWRVEGHPVATFRTRQTLINWIPNMVCLFVLWQTEGWKAVKKLFAGFLKWKVGFRIWSWAIILPLASSVAATVFQGLRGGELQFTQLPYLPLVLLIRFLLALTTESVGGEAGWRGFAQARLQEKYHPLLTSFWVGLLWGLSHLPIVTIRGFNAQELWYFMVSIISLSIILTWFYNTTHGSLLVVAFVHALMNVVDASLSRLFTAIMSRSDFMFVFMMALGMAAGSMIMTTRGRLGLAKIKV